MIPRHLTIPTLLLTLAATPATSPSTTPPLLTQARHILSTLKETQYTHPTKINESTASYHCDCSGFICYLLRQSSPSLYTLIPHPHTKRPLAADFYTAFTTFPTTNVPPRLAAPLAGAHPPLPSYPSWQQIPRLADALPGDILAWRRPQIIKGQDTGHTMILDTAPTPDGDNTFRVTVIDSTSSPHANDSRPPNTSGIGRGTLWFHVNPSGHPTGFRWKSNGPTFTSLPIAIGRMIQPAP